MCPVTEQVMDTGRAISLVWAISAQDAERGRGPQGVGTLQSSPHCMEVMSHGDPRGRQMPVSEGDSGEPEPPRLSAPYKVTAFEPSVTDTADSRVLSTPRLPADRGTLEVTMRPRGVWEPRACRPLQQVWACLLQAVPGCTARLHAPVLHSAHGPYRPFGSGARSSGRPLCHSHSTGLFSTSTSCLESPFPTVCH